MRTSSEGTSRSLPPKWDCFFKQIVKQYETKQYEKALRSANEMLKEWPGHPETLAMKGHLLMFSEKESVDQSPLELGRQAVRLDIRSAFCWRLLGKMYQTQKIYNEAIKCYRQVVKLDAENFHVMQDLAVMEICERDLTGLIKTRKSLLRAVPSDRVNWMGLAIAYELNGDLATAVKVVEEFERSNNSILEPLEQSEHQLYKIRLLMKEEKYREVLELLPSISNMILEKKKLLSIEAECLQHSEKKEQAESLYRSLLQEDPDSLSAIQGIVYARTSFHFTYDFKEHKNLQKCKEVELLLDDLSSISPLAKHLALSVSDNITFISKIRNFLIPYVKLNIPSVFNTIKRFYGSAEKSGQIEDCLLSFEMELEESGNFVGETYPNPTAIFWVYLLLCIHYIRVSKIATADLYFEKAKEHSPTSDMVYVIQARLAKAKRDSVSLFSALQLTTQLDPKDRYSSNRYVKHLLRNHEFEHAENVFKEFNSIREKDMLKHIVEIQCIWYEHELAQASYQCNDILTALQIYLLIIKQFDNFRREESDFHLYCLRRGMLCAYLDTLESNDKLTSHPSRILAAQGAVECLIDVYDTEDVTQLESRRTQYGKNIAISESIGKLPDLNRPLSKALDLIKYLEQHDHLKAKSFILSGRVHFKLEEYQVSVEKLKHALIIDGVVDYQAQSLVSMLEKVDSVSSSMEEIRHML